MISLSVCPGLGVVGGIAFFFSGVCIKYKIFNCDEL